MNIQTLQEAIAFNNQEVTEYCWWYNIYKHAEDIVDYSQCKNVDEKVKLFHSTVQSIYNFEELNQKYWTPDVTEAFPTQGNIATLIEKKMFYFALPKLDITQES
jgi:hypothetical protein